MDLRKLRSISRESIKIEPFSKRPDIFVSICLATAQAICWGKKEVTLIELGVYNGDGLELMTQMAKHLTSKIGMKYKIYGFDTFKGLTPLEGFADHNEIWKEGEYASTDTYEQMCKRFKGKATLIKGDVKETIPTFLENVLSSDSPLAFVSLDLDLYSSSKNALKVLESNDAAKYIPAIPMIVDDQDYLITYNDWCGEGKAIREFNKYNEFRKIQNRREIYQRLRLINILDHPIRTGDEIPNQPLKINFKHYIKFNERSLNIPNILKPDRKKLRPKLCIGPMSKNIVDAVIELSNDNITLGFCASRRQVEYDGGYVNNWTTESFVKYVKNKSSNLLLCRDHGGPGQGNDMDDGLDSFSYDSKYMDLIHIDPWKKFQSLEDGLKKTIEDINYCYSINKKCLYEVGTEESIRRMTSAELHTFLTGLKNGLDGKVFNKIIYAVIQSGTSLEEDGNTGNYEESRLKDMISVCKEFSLLSKEHNGDYLDKKTYKEKFDLGLDSINIAPEFGTIETLCILDRIKNDTNLFEEIYNICYNSGKWKKWVAKDFDPHSNKKQIVKISCHYVFSDEKFRNILKSRLFEGIDAEIKLKVKTRILEIIN